MIHPERVPGLLADLAPYLSLICEGQVLDFSTRAQYGAWFKMRVPEPGLLRGMKANQRYHLLLIRVMEDEMPATPDPEKRRPYRTSQLAGFLCSQEDFRHFITQTYGQACHNADAAAQWVREACNVPSRSLLDSDETAAETFKRIAKAYDEWKQGAGDGN